MNKPFILNCLYLEAIPQIDGYGVYTYEPIPAGTEIEISPVFLYPQDLLNTVIYMAQSEGVKDSDIGLDQYAVDWIDVDEMQKTAVLLGYLSIYNHSSNNNAEFFTDYTDRLVGIKTIRDIAVGEQITVSYGPHWVEAKKDYIDIIEF